MYILVWSSDTLLNTLYIDKHVSLGYFPARCSVRLNQDSADWSFHFQIIFRSVHTVWYSWRLKVEMDTIPYLFFDGLDFQRVTRRHNWLVVWLPFFIFSYIGNNHPNWLSYFSEGWPNHQPDKNLNQQELALKAHCEGILQRLYRGEWILKVTPRHLSHITGPKLKVLKWSWGANGLPWRKVFARPDIRKNWMRSCCWMWNFRIQKISSRSRESRHLTLQDVTFTRDLRGFSMVSSHG